VTTDRLVELVLAVILLGAGLWLYTRRTPRTDGTSGRRDSQGAVLLLAVGVIVGIHALGLLEYRPSPSEIELAHSR